MKKQVRRFAKKRVQRFAKKRVRRFAMKKGLASFADGSNAAMQNLASETVTRMRAALDDDLNTAQAQAAIFDMVRHANAAFDTGGIKKDDVAPLWVACCFCG